MCPACLATLAVIAVGTGSAGGLTAVVAKKIYDRRAAKAQGEPTTLEEPHTKEQER